MIFIESAKLILKCFYLVIESNKVPIFDFMQIKFNSISESIRKYGIIV